MKRVTVDYYNEDKYKLISDENIALYEAYMRSKSIKSKETMESTYTLYQRNFMYFLVFLAEKYDNIGLYSAEFMKNGADIVEDYMYFCQTVLKNNKKTINNKVSAIASFYKWSNIKRLIDGDPIYGKIERMVRADQEHILNDYYLNDDQIYQITSTLLSDTKNFDFMDKLLWFIFYDSANRLNAISQLSISQINYENLSFENVIEKEQRQVDIAISSSTMEMIKDWIEIRKTSYDMLSNDALFITKSKGSWNRMTQRTIQRRIQKIGMIVNIPDLHPHSIRKTVASGMLEKGVDSLLISMYLNHKSLDVIKNYIKPKSSVEIRDEIQKQLNR